MRLGQRGITLIELLLVLALLGLALVGGWNAFSLGQQAWQRYQIRMEAESAVRLASLMITHELTNGSYLEIRNSSNNWSSGELNNDDRIIMINNGDIIIREIATSGDSDTIIASMDQGGLSLSFTKPLNITDGNSPHHPIANTLQYTITARDNSNNLVYDMASTISLSNMLPGAGVPVSTSSLYSTPSVSNYTPGDRILYRTEVDRFSPSTPSGDFSCGL